MFIRKCSNIPIGVTKRVKVPAENSILSVIEGEEHEETANILEKVNISVGEQSLLSGNKEVDV